MSGTSCLSARTLWFSLTIQQASSDSWTWWLQGPNCSKRVGFNVQTLSSFGLHQVCYCPSIGQSKSYGQVIGKDQRKNYGEGQNLWPFFNLLKQKLPRATFQTHLSPGHTLIIRWISSLLSTRLLASLWGSTTIGYLAKSAQMLYSVIHLINSTHIYCGLYLCKATQYMLSDNQYDMKERVRRNNYLLTMYQKVFSHLIFVSALLGRRSQVQQRSSSMSSRSLVLSFRSTTLGLVFILITVIS